MPAFNSYDGIKRKLLSDIPAVWTTVHKIYFGRPQITPKEYPYVVVTLPPGPLRQEPHTVKSFLQYPSLQITKVDVLPADKTINILDRQVSEANAMITRLEAATTYGDDGTGSAVIQDQYGTFVQPDDPLVDDKDHVYEVTINLDGRVLEHHSSFTP